MTLLFNALANMKTPYIDLYTSTAVASEIITPVPFMQFIPLVIIMFRLSLTASGVSLFFRTYK